MSLLFACAGPVENWENWEGLNLVQLETGAEIFVPGGFYYSVNCDDPSRVLQLLEQEMHWNESYVELYAPGGPEKVGYCNRPQDPVPQRLQPGEYLGCARFRRPGARLMGHMESGPRPCLFLELGRCRGKDGGQQVELVACCPWDEGGEEPQFKTLRQRKRAEILSRTTGIDHCFPSRLIADGREFSIHSVSYAYSGSGYGELYRRWLVQSRQIPQPWVPRRLAIIRGRAGAEQFPWPVVQLLGAFKPQEHTLLLEQKAVVHKDMEEITLCFCGREAEPCAVYLEGVEEYDMRRQVEESARKRQDILDEMSEQERQDWRRHMDETIDRLCPAGQVLKILRYEADRPNYMLCFESTDELDQPIKMRKGGGDVGVVYRGELGPHGTRMGGHVLGSGAPGDDAPIHVELFSVSWSIPRGEKIELM